MRNSVTNIHWVPLVAEAEQPAVESPSAALELRACALRDGFAAGAPAQVMTAPA